MTFFAVDVTKKRANPVNPIWCSSVAADLPTATTTK